MAARRPAPTPSPEFSDERFLVEAAQRDPAKFDALYELHFERVYAFVAYRTRDRATAEDLTSDVFHKALANLPSYEWRGVPFAAWLFRIAANAVADQFKRAAREVSAANAGADHSKRTAREVPASDDPPSLPSKAGQESLDLAVADLEAVETRARLFQLVGGLPEVQRQVVYQRFVEQRSIREIARQLRRTEGAVKQLQFRAIQTLRAQMEGRHA